MYYNAKTTDMNAIFVKKTDTFINIFLVVELTLI